MPWLGEDLVVAEDAGLHGARQHPPDHPMHGPAHDGAGRTQTEEGRRALAVRHHHGQRYREHRYAEDVSDELLDVHRAIAEEHIERKLGPDVDDVPEVVVHIRDEELLQVKRDQLRVP